MPVSSTLGYQDIMGSNSRFRTSVIFSSLVLAGCGSQIEHGNVAFDISPDGEQVAFSSADGDLFIFELEARTVRQLTKTAAIESTPATSPDGKSIIYAATAEDRSGSRIFQILLDGTGAKPLTNDADVFDRLPTYSPDGLQIAFARARRHRPYSMGGWRWDDWDVYVADVDGGNIKRLTQNSYYEIGGVEFSADGKTILYSADNNRGASDLKSNVFEVPVDGSAPPAPAIPQPTAPGKYAAWASQPAFSPNGKKLVVISDRAAAYQYDLVLIDVASGKSKALDATRVSRYNQQPVFTSDGRRILFLAGTEWNAGSRPIFSLWSIDLDGRNAREIADSQLFKDPGKWRAP